MLSRSDTIIDKTLLSSIQEEYLSIINNHTMIVQKRIDEMKIEMRRHKMGYERYILLMKRYDLREKTFEKLIKKASNDIEPYFVQDYHRYLELQDKINRSIGFRLRNDDLWMTDQGIIDTSKLITPRKARKNLQWNISRYISVMSQICYTYDVNNDDAIYPLMVSIEMKIEEND
jgi:hypothetical protein